MNTELSRRDALRAGILGSTAGLSGCLGIEKLFTPDPPEPTTSIGSWPQMGYDAQNSGAPTDESGPSSKPSEQWVFNTGNVISSTVVIDEGTLYAGSYNTASNGIYALDVATGEKLWEYSVYHYVGYAPAVSDGIMYIGATVPKRNERPTSGPLALENGAKQWQLRGGSLRSPPTIAGDTLYYGTTGGALRAVKKADGEVRWEVNAGNTIKSAPAVADGAVYVVSEEGNLSAFDVDSGDHIWTVTIVEKAEIRTAPVVHENFAFVGTSTGDLVTVDTSGERRWTGEVHGVGTGGAASAGGRVVTTTMTDNRVTAFDIQTGNNLWVYQGSEQIMAPPVIVDETVYVTSRDGNIYALDFETGAEQWIYSLGETTMSSPVLVDGSLYIGTKNGKIYGLA